MQESLSGLLQAQPHHVCCLVSNDKQTPGHFDKEVVGQQIQSMAIFETVDFIQCGRGLRHSDVTFYYVVITSLVYYTAYTRSQLCEEFIERYGFLATGVSGPHSTAREMAEVREEREREDTGGRVCVWCISVCRR